MNWLKSFGGAIAERTRRWLPPPAAPAIRLFHGAVSSLMRRLREAEEPPAAINRLSDAERRIVRQIRRDTATANVNNVTRTAAYLELYLRTPELHWALLAHMVSRNGGWNMTDLKGSLLPRLMSPEQTSRVFLFLERANSLIFQDAYPQLLLYRESVRQGRPLFHLLPAFHVSRFMRIVWPYMWESPNSSLLTAAMIVNEQHYIEGRLVQEPRMRDRVLDTYFARAQAVLGLNQVVLPSANDAERSGRANIVGITLAHFASLRERIAAGRHLYALLFGDASRLHACVAFAKARPHTGSRADYWPELFSPASAEPLDAAYESKLDGSGLKAGVAPLFSPTLPQAWDIVRPSNVSRYDWFRDADDIAPYFTDIRPPRRTVDAAKHARSLAIIEKAVIAEETLY